MHFRKSIPLVLTMVALVSCRREATPPPASGAPEPRAAELAALAALPIQVEQSLDPNVRLAGYSVARRQDGRGWEITLSSKLVKPSNRAAVWVHAYPANQREYLALDPLGSAASPSGLIFKDRFGLDAPGVFNLYAGETKPDGTLGPAMSLGWIAVGEPASPQFRDALKVLAQKGGAPRAALMLEAALRDYPEAAFPEAERIAIEHEGGRFDALRPYYQKRLDQGWRPGGIDDWLALTATIQATGWKDQGAGFDALLAGAPAPLRTVAAMAGDARRRARGDNATGQATAVPYQLQFKPPVTSADLGLRLLGLAVVPGERLNSFRIYLFMQADRDVTDDTPFWLHAYRDKSDAYEDALAQRVPHPSSLRAGYSTWRAFDLSRPGPYTIYIGWTRPDGSLGPSQPLGWLAVGQPGSRAFLDALDTIATRGEPTRALEIATGVLDEYPQNPALKKWAATHSSPPVKPAS